MSSQELSNFIYIEGGRNLPGGKFTRNEYMTIDQVQEYRKKNNNTGIYLTAYVYDSPDVKEANLYADFYLDFDAEGEFEKARQDALSAITYLKQTFTYNIPESFIRIYFSGKKGLHLVVPAVVFGVEPDKHLNEYYKSMASRIAEEAKNGTLDLKIYDRRRLFRMANSRHADTLLYKIPLTYFELVMMSEEEIKELAQKPRAIQYETGYEITRAKQEHLNHIEKWSQRFGKKFDNTRRESKPLDFVPPCVQRVIDNGPVRGQRNLSTAALTSFWKRQGNSEQEVWDLLVKWNNESLPEWELKNTMQSIYHGDYEYGCMTFEQLSGCDGSTCPLYPAYNKQQMGGKRNGSR